MRLQIMAPTINKMIQQQLNEGSQTSRSSSPQDIKVELVSESSNSTGQKYNNSYGDKVDSEKRKSFEQDDSICMKVSEELRKPNFDEQDLKQSPPLPQSRGEIQIPDASLSPSPIQKNKYFIRDNLPASLNESKKIDDFAISAHESPNKLDSLQSELYDVQIENNLSDFDYKEFQETFMTKTQTQ